MHSIRAFIIPSLVAFALIMPAILYAQDAEDSTEKSWESSIAGYYYFIPDQKIHPTIIGYTNHKSFHIEARYNYEDFNTASVFGGYTWSKDGGFSYTITPMIGLALGNANGILPGLECSASYSKFNLYSENEYMLDFKGRGNYFFYSWTQLSTPVIKNIQAGVLAQSFRWYKSKFDIQKGVYAEYAPGNFLFDVYCFNPFSEYNFFTASISFQF